jgi:uncharacterized protein
MKFDRIIQKLLPHDENFYRFFEQASRNIVQAAALLKELVITNEASDRDKLIMQIKELEHHGDSITHQIFSELNATFVTPFDREDIHELASALDDVLDHMDGTASRASLYKLTEFPEAVIKLIDVLQLSIGELDLGVGMLRDINKKNELQRVFQKVNDYENIADDIFDNAVAELFDKEKDAIRIIKIKEILVGLETATDKCEDAANVLEGIYIKNA